MLEDYLEDYDDYGGYDDMDLEEILIEEPDCLVFDDTDAWRNEVGVAVAKVTGDQYLLNNDDYLVEIEKGMDGFRGKSKLDDQHTWRDELEQAVAEVRQSGFKIRK